MPAADTSAMDGYAVRSADLSRASRTSPVPLTVTSCLHAGGDGVGPVGPGQAVKIMTGATVPSGCDAVVAVEETRSTRDTVWIGSRPRSGRNVRSVGEDVPAGTDLLRAGVTLGPAQLAVAAMVGLATLPVWAPLRVGVLSCGVELTEPGSPRRQGAVFDSNLPMIVSLIEQAGASVVWSHRCGDDPSVLARALEGLDIDLLVTTAGTSAGDREVIRELMEPAGVTFRHVDVRPGAPQGAGRFGRLPVIALPGVPVAAWVSAQLYVLPFVRSAMGGPPDAATVAAVLADDVRTNGKRQYVLGIVDAVTVTVPFAGRRSPRALALSNCLIEIPDGTCLIRAGTTIRAMLT